MTKEEEQEKILSECIPSKYIKKSHAAEVEYSSTSTVTNDTTQQQQCTTSTRTTYCVYSMYIFIKFTFGIGKYLSIFTQSKYTPSITPQ
jgi:hypothetical protein